MEHRIGKRVIWDFYVEVLQGGRSHGRFSVANIGQGGVSFSGLEGTVNEGDLLTLKFYCEKDSKQPVFVRRAMVVHSSDNDPGLMWVDTQHDFLALINTMNDIAA